MSNWFEVVQAHKAKINYRLSLKPEEFSCLICSRTGYDIETRRKVCGLHSNTPFLAVSYMYCDYHAVQEDPKNERGLPAVDK